jgi:hypothetical protein
MFGDSIKLDRIDAAIEFLGARDAMALQEVARLVRNNEAGTLGIGERGSAIYSHPIAGKSLAGAAFGFEEDENGNIVYNPAKGLMGAAVGFGASRAIGSKLTPQTLKAQTTAVKPNIGGTVKSGTGAIKEQGADIKGIFAGERAANAPLSPLAKAKELTLEGKDEKRIFSQTGWYKDKDGKWKFEIDDSAMEIRNALLTKMRYRGKEVKLGDVVKHAKLFERYPQLKNYRVDEVPFASYYDAAYDDVNKALLIKNSVDKTALAHEIQHAVQHIEGFAKGGDIIDGRRIAYEKLTPKDKEIIAADIAKEVFWEYPLGMRNMNLDVLGEIAKDETRGTGVPAKDVLELLKNKSADEIKEIAKSPYPRPNGFAEYRKLHGEAEARAVEARIGMNAEKRAETFPYKSFDVNPEETHINFHKRLAASIKDKARLGAGDAIKTLKSDYGIGFEALEHNGEYDTFWFKRVGKEKEILGRYGDETPQSLLKRIENEGKELVYITRKIKPDELKAIDGSNKRIPVRKVSKEELSKIREGFKKEGIELGEFKYPDNVEHTIDGYQVRHTLNQHGAIPKETQRQQTPITLEHIARYMDIVENPDRVSYGATRNQTPAIRYTKEVNGKAVVVEEVRTGKDELAFFDMYIKEKGTPTLMLEKERAREAIDPSLNVQNRLPYSGSEIMPTAKKTADASLSLPYSGNEPASTANNKTIDPALTSKNRTPPYSGGELVPTAKKTIPQANLKSQATTPAAASKPTSEAKPIKPQGLDLAKAFAPIGAAGAAYEAMRARQENDRKHNLHAAIEGRTHPNDKANNIDWKGLGAVLANIGQLRQRSVNA